MKTKSEIEKIVSQIKDNPELMSGFDTLLCEQSFYHFVKKSWESIEGGVPFIDNWHIQAICEHLEACYRREIKKLIVNVPPRTSKSTIVSVMFPAWVWVNDPSEKFMYASYATALSLEHSLKCRRLIESEWFQDRWGDRVILARDQKAKSVFENTAKGARVSTSVGSSTIGRGANFLIADDPNNMQDSVSDVKRGNAQLWWDQVWSTRRNNPKRDVRIVIQQRLHQQDISGHILEKDDASEWVRLVLPMEFEESQRSRTIVLPSTDGEIWEDPRCEEGQLLAEERFSKHEIKAYKQNLGTYGYAGQYQQRPSPEEGGIIKKAWFPLWTSNIRPEITMVIQSWDTAMTANKNSAYSACTTWGLFDDEYQRPNLILLHKWQGRVEYPELRKKAKELYTRQKFRVDILLVEAKASGDSLIQDLRHAGIEARAFRPDKHGDKIGRVKLVTPIIENGRVWMPTMSEERPYLHKYAEEFLENVITFPNNDSRDLVDTMTQAILFLKQSGTLYVSTDPREEEDLQERKPVYGRI